MNIRKTLGLFSIPLVALTLSACTYNDPTTLPPGQYEHSSTTVDSKGTARSVESSTRVYYDEHGNKKATVDQSTSTDPKGLFNKSTTETSKTVE